MLWLWIVGVLAALIVLLCLTRVGVHAVFGEETTVDVTVGFFRFRVLPGKEKTQKPKKEAENPPKEAAEPQKKKSSLRKLTAAEIKDAVRTLVPALKRALRRTRRGIRVRPLRLSLTLGGAEDPAKTAQNYGTLNGAVWTVMPVLEHLLVIPDPRIHVGVDFDTAQTVLEGEAGLSLRIGTLLAVGFGLAVPALKWFLRYRKQAKQQPAPVDAGAAAA